MGENGVEDGWGTGGQEDGVRTGVSPQRYNNNFPIFSINHILKNKCKGEYRTPPKMIVMKFLHAYFARDSFSNLPIYICFSPALTCKRNQFLKHKELIASKL